MKAALLLHGFVTDRNDFKNLIPTIKPYYDYVDAILFPGHGKGNDYHEFTKEKTFKCMIEEFDMLSEKYEEIDVFGFSMGGALATYLQRIRKVHKLILLAPANHYLNFNILLEKVAFYFDYIKASFSKEKQQEKYIEAYNRIKNVRVDERNSFLISIERLIPNYTFRNVLTFTRIVKDCNEGLIEITPPTLIVWGNFDQLVPHKSVEKLYKICKNEKSRLIELQDISHLMLNSNEISSILKAIEEFVCE